ncbi:AIG2 family protein [Colletotrichum tabaci]|uniref:gamma-glutamylcyclotransferase n=1 Tax=Colletotrichum tabaci TaxID=1209068 RepID=A0AAV9SVL8_9PEZI
MATPTPRLYFAYGSNLSPTQMALRCPSSVPVGLAHLPDYTFIINSRHYANVVRNVTPTSGTHAVAAPGGSDRSSSSSGGDNSSDPQTSPANLGVYGVLYILPPADEAVLDRCEGVPYAYQKENLLVTVVSATGPNGGGDDDDSIARPRNGATIAALVYVDNDRVEPSTPWDEYVDRMNRGVDEATRLFGLPAGYVDYVIRPYIPASEEASVADYTAIGDPFLERA